MDKRGQEDGWTPRAVLVTSRAKIQDVVARYRRQYGHQLDMKLWDGRTAREVLVQLEALDLSTATHDDVAEVIGNSGWTKDICGSCTTYVDEYVHLGDEPDYESTTFYICIPCLQYASALARGEKAED